MKFKVILRSFLTNRVICEEVFDNCVDAMTFARRAEVYEVFCLAEIIEEEV